jgi:hypothetical protein
MKLGKTLGAGIAAVSSLLLIAAPAGATNASATLTAGPFGFAGSLGDVTFPAVALNGQNKSVSAPQSLDIADATGSGSGWNVTATSTAFTSGSYKLPSTATAITSAPAAATCDAGVTCTPAGSNSVSYPYFLPAGATAPTATKLFNAAANTGMGDQSFTPNWTLAIPGNAYAGNYTSTWTISLVSGP